MMPPVKMDKDMLFEVNKLGGYRPASPRLSANPDLKNAIVREQRTEIVIIALPAGPGGQRLRRHRPRRELQIVRFRPYP